MSSTDKFCPECGARLAATAPAPPAAVAESSQERRFVTALFIDLVGFTPLTEVRDSEDVRQMLTVYFDRAREIVRRFGGVIDKYIGDAVMAVWGAHVAHEDDPERAVRAALELVEAVAGLGPTFALPDLRARAGVLSGSAAVGGDGNAGTGLIIGDIVNTASRLQSAAEAGTVLVAHPTNELAPGIEFEPVGDVALKGKAEPVAAFRAVRVVGGHGASRRTEGLVPPFVGRDDELRILKDTLHAVEREERLRLVSVVGQAGLGKSRLADELWNYVDGLSKTVYWHHGRSPAYGEGLGLWALGEMVRQRCGIAETDEVHRTRTRLRTALAEFVPDAADRAWVEPRLEALLGLAEVASSDRAELFAAWRLLFLRISLQGPVVMVFEDLHWADDGLLDFIDELVAAGSDVPILVVTLARPELLERRPGWGSGRASCLSLYLAPLPPAVMRELVTGVVADAPAALVERLVERAGGVPLYAVEMLRMLLARELIEPAGGARFRMSGDVADVEVPDSLQALVGARLDQLEPAARALIADAAVLGQSFTLEGLGALRGDGHETLVSALEPLVRREILSVNRDPRSPERGQYRFVQSIIREVAHQRIGRADRVARHLRVAEYFESLDDPELAGAAAAQYLDALEAAPEEQRAGLRARVTASLLSAADRAAALRSHAQVLRLCRRGIELAGEAAARGELLVRAATAAHSLLDHEAESLARRALAAFEEAGEEAGRVRAASALARQLDDTGRANEAWPLLREVLEAVSGDGVEHAAAMAELARAFMLDGRSEEAIAWSDRALAAAEAKDLVPTIAEAWTTKGAALGNVFRTREAVVLLEAALVVAREHQLSRTKRRILMNLGYVRSADTPIAEELNLERLDDARRLGDPRLIAEALVDRAEDCVALLDFAAFDRVMSELDRTTLPDQIAARYDDATSERMLVCGKVEAAIALDERRWAESIPGDGQVVRWREMRRGMHAFYRGQMAEGFAIFIDVDFASPGSPDAGWALLAALRLGERERLAQVLELLDRRPYRGRAVELMKAAAGGGIAVLEGRRADGEALLERAIALADEVWGPLYGNMCKAAAVRFLGFDHPLGLRCGREAYDAWSAVGATTLLELFADALLPPEAAVGRSA